MVVAPEILPLFAIPFIVALVAWRMDMRNITVNEFILQVVLSAVFAVGSYSIGAWGAMQDTEYWHGRVHAKREGSQSCCHCRTVCDSHDKNGNCTSSHEECDHIMDQWWALDITTGDVVEDTCASPLASPPDWWTKAKKGDTATIAHQYTNYLLADPESLNIPGGGDQYLDRVPPWPKNEHGQLKSRRALGVGVKPPRDWNEKLSQINADIGGKHQVDLMVIVTNIDDPQFSYAVDQKWVYGPKNALTIILGVDNQREITWAGVSSVSAIEELRIDVREDLPGHSLDDPHLLGSIKQLVTSEFRRKPMSDFDYLKSAAKPKGWSLFWVYILNILAAAGLTILFIKKDVV